MKVGILGTGMVGNAIGTKLVETGHQTMMGSRTAGSEAGKEWQKSTGGKGQIGTFAEAEVKKHLGAWFGWKPGNVIDLGDITGSRGTEMFLPLWLRLFGMFGDATFNIQVVRGAVK